MADITTIADVGTAVGTFFLGTATLLAVRSANRAARVAERALLLDLRPVLVPARREDPELKILFGDGRKFALAPTDALVRLEEDVVYLALPVRNVGTGLAVLQAYDVSFDRGLIAPHHTTDSGVPDRVERHFGPLDGFRDQQRDIYVAPGDSGYWHAALRNVEDPLREELASSLRDEPRALAIDLLYGDREGNQLSVSRFVAFPVEDGRWLFNVSFHWTVDGRDPREN